MNRAVFLDRDGTIIKDKGYLKHPAEVEFYKDTLGALQALQKHFMLFVVTNQPGIAKGLITTGEVDSIHEFIAVHLREHGIFIRQFFYCPHLKEDQCICRKPKPFFLDQCARKFSVDLTSSFVIGDHPSDIQLAVNAGAQGIYLLTGHGKKHVAELPGKIGKPVKITGNIKYATAHILNQVQGAVRLRDNPIDTAD
jgi:D-glycero-D-manno-heptose 1,7-bisphosphate phosphatase